MELGAAALADGGAVHVPGPGAMWVGARVAGPAVTARVDSGDNLAVQVAVAESEPGSVVVVEVTPGSGTAGIWGEVITVAAQERGIVGVVVDGPVRDLGPTTAVGFPVFATGVCPVGPTKCGGRVGGVVRIGGVVVSPGDWIVADADGVVVLPTDELEAIVGRAAAKADREPAIIDGLRKGGTTMDLLGLDTSPVQRG